MFWNLCLIPGMAASYTNIGWEDIEGYHSNTLQLSSKQVFSKLSLLPEGSSVSYGCVRTCKL